MENFDDFENKNYVQARHVNYTVRDLIGFAVYFAGSIVKITAMLVIELAGSFVNYFRADQSKNIEGQLALVTGGANGLGRAIAFRLAQEKCKIVIADLNFNEAERTALEITQKFNVETLPLKVDVSDFEAIKELKDKIESTLGTLDILVNNAGILSKISLREGQPSDLQKVIDVNLTSHFWTIRTFLDGMIERRRGHIVAISSLGGKISFPLACAYSATKHGVRGLMNALYDELCIDDSDDYIKMTTVYPAFISTRRELSDILDSTKEITPRMSPKYVANKIVEGVLLNKRDVTLPPAAGLLQLVNFLPPKTWKFAKTQLVPVAHLQQKR